jgi:hypothetical protein
MNTFVPQFPRRAVAWYPQQRQQWVSHQISQSLFCCLPGLSQPGQGVKCPHTVYSDRAGFKGHRGWRTTALRPNLYVKLLTIQKDGNRNVDFPRDGKIIRIYVKFIFVITNL